MKKMIAAFLAVLYVATALTGCAASQDTQETTQETTVETTVETTQETTVETTVETTEETVPETTAAPTKPVQTTPTPSVGPAPAGSHAIAGSVPGSAAVSASYFDDAVFVGDSISLKLSYYAVGNQLGTAQFLTSGSLGSGNALWEVSSKSVHPSYQGNKMKLEESIPLTGAKKLYIMLGMNDIAVYGVDGAVNNMKTLIGKILAAVPGMQVYIQSMTPTTSTSNITSSGGINRNSIRQYNEALAAACQANGWYFVNVAEVMYDANGYLIRDYCSDPDGMGIHFTSVGCEAWINYLYTHTAG